MVRDDFRGYYDIDSMDEFKTHIVQHGTYISKWKEQDRFKEIAELLFEQIAGARKYLCFHERGIWPNSENNYLMEALCSYTIGKTHLQLSDILELEDQDRLAGISFMQLALEFGWGGLLYSNRLCWFYFSHDGWRVLSTLAELSPYSGDILDIKRTVQAEDL